ncbi:DNA-binding transcriptional regulator, MocR family, contains an aminotransferase domain [Devosia enhydra]|uniref:DNA-binding transcriptional regulator, MocR family, contains an aminotransferase domain n=1 Tax=Devosia enhydra TaxID=665118 RepID=A0A1K2HSI6_9HYPH|nr:aminotransferase class I/II-fold pyridoxal phosphate-dependent enzyme [Devosia enhydra]SFZ80752.1 DNA-binding transcriptional regulator, MocR family, contains an aminotransferase domain [Devosia enhydra]
MLERIVKRVPMRNPRALSRTIMEMVAEGELSQGMRMPTVREVADALGMSPAGVAAAWRELVDWRVLETRRRGGTTVLGPAVPRRATRYDVMMKASEGIPLNIGHLTPDKTILPPLERAFAAALGDARVHDAAPDPISQRLREAVEPNWPFQPGFMMATHGGIAAAELALQTSVRPGDRVIVDAPTVSRILDILEALGARAVPVTYREGGPDLGELRTALAMRPAAFVYQPVGNHPTGFSVTPEWIGRAADLLAEAHMPIIELVQAPLMHAQPWLSLGTRLPRIVVHVHAYNFFTGTDLRVGVAGGSSYYIDRMWQKLTFSSGWVSRILQNALAFQLTDATALAELQRYVDTCRRRHADMLDSLARVGFSLPRTDGPTIWLPVPDEYVVTNQLSSRGIVVHPGSYFAPAPLDIDHVLINGSALGSQQTLVAETIGSIVSAIVPRGR